MAKGRSNYYLAIYGLAYDGSDDDDSDIRAKLGIALTIPLILPILGPPILVKAILITTTTNLRQFQGLELP